jgi:hypothetical protein
MNWKAKMTSGNKKVWDLTPKELVEAAKRVSLGRGPPGIYCSLEELITLLDAGAKPLRINELDNSDGTGTMYVHEVEYEGCRFISTSLYSKELKKYEDFEIK